MSVEQYQSKLAALDKEISKLEKKKADADSESASLQSKIAGVERSISKNTSQGTLKAKMRSIEGYNKQRIKIDSLSADLGKDIAKKKIDRATCYKKLQDAQKSEQQQQERENSRIIATYETQISNLQNRLEQSLRTLGKQNDHSRNQDNSRQDTPKFDVFISHASEDKETFVDEFVEELHQRNLRVWYDKENIGWGDSIRGSIDKGLSNSRFGIVVLSPDYIAEGKYWTKKELDALFELETINGKVILPIWHNLTKKQLIEYSPIIAGRKALSTGICTPQEIADNVLKTVGSCNDEEG